MDGTERHEAGPERAGRGKLGLSFGELLTGLSQDLLRLVRNEIKFAQVDLTQRAAKAGKDVVPMAVGGAVAFLGAMALVFAAIVCLSRVMAADLSALIVGLVLTALGAILYRNGRRKLQSEELKPHRAIEEFKEDKEWLKERMM